MYVPESGFIWVFFSWLDSDLKTGNIPYRLCGPVLLTASQKETHNICLSIAGDTKLNQWVRKCPHESLCWPRSAGGKGLKPTRRPFVSSYVVISTHSLRRQPGILLEVAEARSGGVLGPQRIYRNSIWNAPWSQVFTVRPRTDYPYQQTAGVFYDGPATSKNLLGQQHPFIDYTPFLGSPTATPDLLLAVKRMSLTNEAWCPIPWGGQY